MSMSGSKSRLAGLTRDLSLQWDETRQHWRDTKSDEFDRRFMSELSALVNRSVLVMEQLDELLLKIRSDCE